MIPGLLEINQIKTLLCLIMHDFLFVFLFCHYFVYSAFPSFFDIESYVFGYPADVICNQTCSMNSKKISKCRTITMVAVT